MVISAVLLLAVLLIAGFSFISTFFHFPTKQLYARFQSLFSKRERDSTECESSSPSPSSSSSSQDKITSPSKLERSGFKKAELKRVFATFDKDGDGFITRKELRESLRNLSIMVTDKEAEEMVARVDANGDGLIEFDEFCLLYQDMMGDGKSGDASDGGDGDGDLNLKDAFDVFDKDKDGLISVEELGAVLTALGLNEGNKMERCREMIRKVDVDGDEMVNFDEFKRMMKAGAAGLLTATATASSV